MKNPWIIKLLLDLGFYSHIDRLAWSKVLQIEFKIKETDLRQALSKSDVRKIILDDFREGKAAAEKLFNEWERQIIDQTKEETEG